MTFFYLLLGLEVLVVLLVTFFLIRKIRAVMKERKERNRGSF